MASSNSGKSKKNSGKGAAEEPEPEPDDSLSSTTTASYDPTIYQRPHPEDRGGGDGKKGNGATTKTDGKTKDKDKDKKDDGGHRCANCDKPGATKRCGRCGVEWYCDHNCQKVSRGGGRVSAAVVEGGRLRARLIPVSYTHLRAHET